MSWRRFFRRGYWDRERAEELQAHLEIEIDENIARGMPSDEARRAAHRKLGNSLRVREEIYDLNSIGWLESLLREFRFALRSMRRRPGFTLAVALTLALGIGANTAIFSVVDNVLIKPLPYPDADRLVTLRHTAPGLQSGDMGISPSLYFTYREQGRVFEHVGIWGAGGQTVSGLGEPEQARALWVSDGVLPALGVQPRTGRWFTAAEDASDYQGPVPVIITDAFWKRRFGADPAAVGRRLTIDSRPAEVIGVMPASFRFLNLQPQPDVILTMQTNRSRIVLSPPTAMATGPTPFGMGLARLKPGVTIEQANADARRLLPVWLEMWPVQPGGFGREAIAGWRLAPAFAPLKSDVVGNIDDMLWVLMGTIALVLLIACANVANLMLVRADSRRQEFSVRAALGAGRLRIAREVLVESLALGAAGGAVGLLLAYGAVRLIVAIGPTDLPRLEEISLDWRALLFTFAASLASSVAFGAMPAFRSAASGDTPVIGNTRGGGESRERHRARNTLVVVQVALALVLLVCSGLMIRTFNALRNVNPGFAAAAQVQTMRVWMPEAAVPGIERFVRAQQEVLNKIQALPGVTAAGFASAIPLEGRPNEQSVFVEGQNYPNGAPPPSRRLKFVSPGFFSAMGTRIVAGRDIGAADLSPNARVALISENFAREVWGSSRAALGRHIHEPTPPGRVPVWREIVGVVEDVHEDGLYQPAPTFAYWPIVMGDFFGQPVFGVRNPVFAIRGAQAGTEALMQPVREAVWSVNPNLPVFLVRTMQDLNNESLAHTSFALVLLALAGAMALGLGIVGIYGVISYVVSQRSREIGLRLALGAQPYALRRMFVRQGLVLTGIGTMFGLAAAAALTRLMSSLLFGISPLDPATYLAVIVVLAAAALLASYLPARRAAMANPMTTLAAECLLLAAVLGSLVSPSPVFAQESISTTEQNALIEKHCAVCHNDTAHNGGLSLEGFSVERAHDSLVAMLLSKMTQGLSVKTLQASHESPAAKALVATRMKGGAMMAAGVAPPSDARMYALIEALAARTTNAANWDMRVEALGGGRQRLTASILREAPRAGDGEAAMYRLIATCTVGGRDGELRLSWSPQPREGRLLVSVDGAAPVAYTVAGMEKMGNGLPGETPPASVVLLNASQRAIGFPRRSLRITGLFGDTVEFPCSALSDAVPREVTSCFGA